jgi:hypothetical protein
MHERTRYLRRPRRTRWRRWAEGLDPWHPRPIDYVFFAAACLLLALVYVGERTWAVQLNRRMFQLEERATSLREGNAALAARANTLADRGRVGGRARRELGMVVPNTDSYRIIYYVPRDGTAPSRTARPPQAVAGFAPAAPAR